MEARWIGLLQVEFEGVADPMSTHIENRCRALIEKLGLGSAEAVKSVVPLTGGVASDIVAVDLGDKTKRHRDRDASRRYRRTNRLHARENFHGSHGKFRRDSSNERLDVFGRVFLLNGR